MSAMMTGLFLLGLFATEAAVVAVSDHVAQVLVRPSVGDAVMAGPPVRLPDELDYSGFTDTDLLRVAAGTDTTKP